MTAEIGDRALGPKASNLPSDLTSFVGRRQELREVKCLLATTRLLTLIGSGGAGKTQLALRAAADLARGFLMARGLSSWPLSRTRCW